MKFSNGVDALSKENQFLQTLTKWLLLIIACLSMVVFVIYDKEPLVVERSVHGLEILKKLPFARDDADLQQAIHLIIKARFDSDAVSPEIFLNLRQLVLREAEQKEMKARSMSQRVIVRVIKITKDEATVEMDRVISVGELRSALKAKIKITFEDTGPTELNPYGLILSLADPVEQKEERK